MAYKTIVAATDFSSFGDAAIEQASELARVCHAKLHILHVVSKLFDEPRVGYVSAQSVALAIAHHEEEARERIEKMIADRDWKGRAIAAALTTDAGNPAAEIVAYAKAHRADLLVCGTHGRHGVGRFLFGSVAEEVLRDAPCPVLAVRGDRQVHGASPMPRIPVIAD